MEHKSLSLSKKLDGGYLHVKKRISRGGSGNSNGRGKVGGYSNYLKRVEGGNIVENKQHKIQGGSRCADPNKKVVSIKLGGSNKKKRGKSPKRKPSSKDISTSSITPIKKVDKPVVKTVKPKQTPIPKKGLPQVMPKTKGSLKKGTVVRRHRGTSKNSRKSRGRSLTRRRAHDLKKGKRISVTKVRKLSNKDVDTIQSKLKSIKGKSSDEIKKELDKQGIKVSGKSPSILKDIYMYSQLCGINIKRE